MGWKLSGGPLNFQAVYYGSRCLLQHNNPYSATEVDRVYRSEGGYSQSAEAWQHRDMTLYVNTPATLLVVAPFAMLPLSAAQWLWTVLNAASLILAAFLMWDLGADYSPVLSGCLVGFLLANCENVFAGGNTAGIVTGLCIVSAWCLLRDSFVPTGILCMALSLVIKPHEAGLVWLFFLLAGGVNRRRAVQTAILAAFLMLPAVLWVSHVAPSWMHDWSSNLAAISAPGGINDPRPTSVTNITADNVISLQAVFSIFSDNPRIYNQASYLVGGVPLLLWAITALRSRFSARLAWLALASVVPLTMIVTYHRVHDAKLLLLMVPACVMLWAEGGAIGRTATLLTAAVFALTADIPLAILCEFSQRLHLSTAALSGQILTVLLVRPDQEILMATGIFFLWVYMRQSQAWGTPAVPREAEQSLVNPSGPG